MRPRRVFEIAACAIAMTLPLGSLGAASAPPAPSPAELAAHDAAASILLGPPPVVSPVTPAALLRPTSNIVAARAGHGPPVPPSPHVNPWTPESWAASLGALEVTNRNTGAHASIRLWDARGAFDEAQADAFMRVAGSTSASSKPEHLDLRLLKLVARASYHFGGAAIGIVSGRRAGAGGRHATGEALDFSLEGVTAATLAAHLRDYPRAGVGIYTHPKTQYVHLDVRDTSYHWIDGSPPGVTWREALLPDPKQPTRDASYVPSFDLPEAAAARAAAR